MSPLPNVAALLERRTQGWIPLDEWGPVCAGCGDKESRIDGYCSIECRDFHSDDEFGELAACLIEAADALDEIARISMDDPAELVDELRVLARAALARLVALDASLKETT